MQKKLNEEKIQWMAEKNTRDRREVLLRINIDYNRLAPVNRKQNHTAFIFFDNYTLYTTTRSI